jgi:pimeloyl-ACP methyl ester carboxylesterase
MLVVFLALVGAACSSGERETEKAGDGGTTPQSQVEETGAGPQEVATDDELYTVPDPIPDGEHGTLLKYLPVDGLVEGAAAYKVMYLSTSLEGAPIVVTGQVVVPTAATPADGRVVLAEAHGTTGIADECAPSKDPKGSEIGALGAAAVANNWIVTMTDYEGLGTPGRHPYLVGESEGRSVIDSVTAAGQLPEAEAGDRVVVAGYSQGGHGALWANQVAAEWAPDLEVVATFAGAPATEIDTILAAGRSIPIGGFIVSIVAGYEAAYPDASPASILTDEGVRRLSAVDGGCLSDVFGATADLAPADLMRADGAQSERWSELAKANNPGQVATKGPVLIIHSDQDEVVPVAFSGTLHERMCSNGQVVERRVLVGGGSHVQAALPAFTEGIAWLKDQLDGKAATNDCPGT